jgi:hypothetical protein
VKKIGTIIINGQAHQLHEAHYRGGRIAIVVDEGRWGKLTVNVPDQPLAPGCIHVKTWGENERLRAPALATGLFEDTGERVPAAPGSFVMAEVWKYRRAP